MLTLVSAEKRVGQPSDRRIKALPDAALKELSLLLEQTYSDVGRPSIPPERLLALAACMRKLLVILNATVKHGRFWQPSEQEFSHCPLSQA